MKVWSQIRNFLKEKKKGILIAIAAILFAIVACFAVRWIVGRVQESNAFDSNSKIYDKVQIKITQDLRNLTEAPMETADGETLEDRNQTETSVTTNETEILEVQKDGDTYRETNSAGETYYYQRNGKEYVLYYDDMYGIKADDGEWVEISAEQTNVVKSFDFSVLDEIDRKQLERDGKVLEPQEEYYDELFFQMLNIDVGRRDKYVVDTVTISLEKAHMEKIEVSYWYDDIYHIKQTYQFAYEDIEIDVPKADKKMEE